MATRRRLTLTILSITGIRIINPGEGLGNRIDLFKSLRLKLEGFFCGNECEVVIMLNKLKRKILRKKLKKEKLDLLCDLIELNKKLKALDDMDEKEKKR